MLFQLQINFVLSLTLKNIFENGDEEDPVFGDDREVGDPRFEREAKFLMMLKGEPDFLRFGDDNFDLFILTCGTGLLWLNVIFSFSTKFCSLIFS